MPHTATFFRQQLTFSAHKGFPVDFINRDRAAIDLYLFNSNSIEGEQISALAEQYLHPHEQAIFAKRKQQQAKQEYLASRIFIKTYASQCWDYDFTELSVLFDNEDTCLKIYYHEQVLPLRCCISHSHGQVLIALVALKATAIAQELKLGVDLEWISTKRSLERVARHYYHAQELQACMTHSESTAEDAVKATQHHALYRIWTLKEALAKAIKQPVAKLLRDNVFSHCAPLQVHSGCYDCANRESYGKSDEGAYKEFDISIISDIELTGSTHINVVTGDLAQVLRKVK